MRFIFLGIFVFSFVMIPFYMLDAVVMPELNGLEKSYANQNQTVQALFSQAYANQK